MSIKQHLKKHQVTYISCVAVAGITYLIMKEPRAILDAGVDNPTKEFTGSFTFLSKNSGNITTNIHKISRGHPGYITKCLETGELFETQGAAAKAFNIPEEVLSKHLNYGRELHEGLHFERLGVLS